MIVRNLSLGAQCGSGVQRMPLNLKLRLQRRAHAMQDALAGAPLKLLSEAGHRRQLAFAIEEGLLNLVQQRLGQIQGLLQGQLLGRNSLGQQAVDVLLRAVQLPGDLRRGWWPICAMS